MIGVQPLEARFGTGFAGRDPGAGAPAMVGAPDERHARSSRPEPGTAG